MTYYELPLSAGQVQALQSALISRFSFVNITVTQTEFRIDLGSHGRTYYEDLACQSDPYRRGHTLTEDDIRRNQVSEYVAGFIAAVKSTNK